jgi:hypothetical protein
METWMPVAFATVIIVGAVGGQLVQMTLKELLPLVRAIAEQKQRQAAAPTDSAVLERLTGIEERMERLERGVQQLNEDKVFMRQLLDRESGVR